MGRPSRYSPEVRRSSPRSGGLTQKTSQGEIEVALRQPVKIQLGQQGIDLRGSAKEQGKQSTLDRLQICRVHAGLGVESQDVVQLGPLSTRALFGEADGVEAVNSSERRPG